MNDALIRALGPGALLAMVGWVGCGGGGAVVPNMPMVDPGECATQVSALDARISGAKEGLQGAATTLNGGGDAVGELVARFDALRSDYDITKKNLCESVVSGKVSLAEYNYMRGCSDRAVKRLRAFDALYTNAARMNPRDFSWVVESELLSVEDALMCEMPDNITMGQVQVNALAHRGIKMFKGVHLNPDGGAIPTSMDDLEAMAKGKMSDVKDQVADQVSATTAAATDQINAVKGQVADKAADATKMATDAMADAQGKLNDAKGQLNDAKGQLDDAKGQLSGAVGGLKGDAMGMAMDMVEEAVDLPEIAIDAQLVCQRQTSPGQFEDMAECDGAEMREDDRFQIKFSVNAPTHLYLMVYNGSGQFQMPFPDKGVANLVMPSTGYTLPGKDLWWSIDEHAGFLEHIQMVASITRISELDALRGADYAPSAYGKLPEVAQRTRGKLEGVTTRGVKMGGAGGAQRVALIPDESTADTIVKPVDTDKLFTEGPGLVAVEFTIDHVK